MSYNISLTTFCNLISGGRSFFADHLIVFYFVYFQTFANQPSYPRLLFACLEKALGFWLFCGYFGEVACYNGLNYLN